MDNEYKVGALCDLIASKGENVTFEKPIKKNKIKKIKDKTTKPYDKSKIIEKKNSTYNYLLNVKSSPKCIEKKSSTVSVDNFENVSNSFEKLIKKKIKKFKGKSKVMEKKKSSDIIDSKCYLEDIENKSGTVSVNNIENISSSFEKPVKKKKLKKSKDNLTKPNNKLKTTETEKPMSKLSIKCSAEYIEKESRTVFVGNVLVNTKESIIKNAFKTFGEVETMRWRSVAVKNLDMPKRVSVMKKDFHPQRDTANVYIRFKTVEQAQSALALNATQFQGHTIRVDLALNTNHKQNSKKGVFIGNLPYSIQEDEVWDFFKDCGSVAAVRIIRDNVTGVSKGIGYVDFEAKESVELALQLQGKKIQNREIRIKRIDTKTIKNQAFNKKPIPFKRTKPVCTNSQNFQGETMKSKTKNKKQKPTKTDLLRRKIAKKLNN